MEAWLRPFTNMREGGEDGFVEEGAAGGHGWDRRSEVRGFVRPHPEEDQGGGGRSGGLRREVGGGLAGGEVALQLERCYRTVKRASPIVESSRNRYARIMRGPMM